MSVGGLIRHSYLFMSDIIHLLPDAVANQIAAGEVVQRPASAVKELMENALDAGATDVRLIIKDAGRTLIQAVDNGKGMSPADAKKSFERHATSKIKNADDLFRLTTMGFRGEALASIAAVAQVELRTKRAEDENGTLIRIEGSAIQEQEPCATPTGTSVSVRNLFFNVPARRNFLKSDTVEFRHIVEEFERIALSHPDRSFELNHNNQSVYRLEKGNAESWIGLFRQRIVALYGNPYNQRLVPVEEHTDIVRINGFIVKPEFAKRTRGEQFFFLNTRFIKNPYLYHAVQSAFQQLLSPDSHPGFFLFLEVDPKTIDVNIHPTKTEVKFEDDKSIYAILKSTVRKSLGQYNISPTLDFEQEMSIELPYKLSDKPVEPPKIYIDTNYNPFTADTRQPMSDLQRSNLNNWQDLYRQHMEQSPEIATGQTEVPLFHALHEKPEGQGFMQLSQRYIVCGIKNGMLIIDQQRAHERVLYERYLKQVEQHQGICQQKLFPDNVEFSPAGAATLNGLLVEINALGFDVAPFGSNAFVIHGVPAGTEHLDSTYLLEGIIQDYSNNEQELLLKPKENIARSMAKRAAVKPGQSLSTEEMKNLVDELFGCEMPSHTPDGKPCFIQTGIDELDRRFKQRS